MALGDSLPVSKILFLAVLSLFTEVLRIVTEQGVEGEEACVHGDLMVRSD